MRKIFFKFSQKDRTLSSFLSKIMLTILIVKTRLSIFCLLGKQTKEYVPIVYAIDLRRLTSVQRNPLNVHEPFGNYALNLKYGLALKWNHENLHSTKFPWNGSISSVEDAQIIGWNDLRKSICFIHTGLLWAFQAFSKKNHLEQIKSGKRVLIDHIIFS